MSVGCSLGWVCYAGGESEDELYRAADRAMYADKRKPLVNRKTRLRLAHDKGGEGARPAA
jgi:hypothetical protein